MILKVVSLSKTRSQEIETLESEYLKRCPQIKIFEPRKALNTPQQELEWFSSRVSTSDYLISLDEKGKQFSTQGFSNHIKSQLLHGRSSFVFVIGSAYGLLPEIKEKSNIIWALSELTFPFQVARLLVVEQLYRSICNINGHPYHK